MNFFRNITPDAEKNGDWCKDCTTGDPWPNVGHFGKHSRTDVWFKL